MSRSNCCVRCLNWMPCSFSTNSVNIENVRHNANQHNDWRSRLWLYVEAPHSSTAARWIRNCRLLLTLLALALVFAETSPAYNLYGPDKRACKATVNHYCNWISECASTSSCKNKWTDTRVDGFTQEEIDMVNVGCFPNATSGYGGCVGDMDGQYKKCDFPNEPLGMTMGENIFGRSFLKHLGKRDGSKKMVAGRIQCTEGKNKISYGITFWTAELVLTIFFFLELVTRLVVATAPDELNWTDWFSDVGNWIDIAAVTTALIEIIGNSVDFGMAEYQVWGWMWNHSTDPGTFRFLRIVVAVRFMLQQRHFRDTKIITSTIYQVAGRLIVPLLLFVLLATIFGGMLYFTEGGVLYDCTDFNAPTKDTCTYCGGPPFVVPFGTGISNLFGKSNDKVGVDWNDNWLGHQEWFNGTCRFLHEAAGGAVTGQGGGKILQTPLIIDAYDGVWTIFVTMTTVGYGGKRPHTTWGKCVVIVAAIFGAFYLAMPLSIISSKFDKNFQITREKQERERIIAERHRVMCGGEGKLKFMHIVKLKIWAKRAKAKAQGHHRVGIRPPSAQVLEYTKALHKFAKQHNYSDLMEFKEIHKELLEHCVTIMSRHMSSS